MRIRHLISLIALLSILSCTQSEKPNKPANKENREIIPDPEGYKKDAAYAQDPEIDKISQIFFGVYCGECGDHCATMYELNLLGNISTMWVDSTDSYFHNNGEIECKTRVKERKRFLLAVDILHHIPAELLSSARPAERFGCPDCSDGCGIYLQILRESKWKKIYIDYQTESLKGRVKEFAEYFKKAFGQLNSKNL